METAKERKETPMARGLLDYFPDACAAVAHLSYIGNEQHNPGEPMHWAREKSSDHADCIIRHLKDRGSVDKDGIGHSVKVAWRGLALLQLEVEAQKMAERNTIYISGPMSGRPSYNFPAFHREAALWRAGGWSVVSPAELDAVRDLDLTKPMTEGTYAELLVEDLRLIREQCSAIVMLPGWSVSTGACLEKEEARVNNLALHYAEGANPTSRKG